MNTEDVRKPICKAIMHELTMLTWLTCLMKNHITEYMYLKHVNAKKQQKP